MDCQGFSMDFPWFSMTFDDFSWIFHGKIPNFSWNMRWCARPMAPMAPMAQDDHGKFSRCTIYNILIYHIIYPMNGFPIDYIYIYVCNYTIYIYIHHHYISTLPSGYLLHSHGKIMKDPPCFNRQTQVNHLFLWAIYTMALLNDQRVTDRMTLILWFCLWSVIIRELVHWSAVTFERC